MKNIISRLSEIEKKLKDKNPIPCLIVDEEIPGIYTYRGLIFHGKEELDKFCRDNNVQHVIIDDLR